MPHSWRYRSRSEQRLSSGRHTARARHVLHCIPTLAQGGAERILATLARFDTEVEHRIVCIFAGPRLFDPGRPVLSLGLPRNSLALVLFPVALLRFVWIVRQYSPDKIVGWLYYGALFASVGKMLGCPVVWSLHATALEEKGSHAGLRLAVALCRRLSWWVPQHIHYCSHEGRAAHRDQGFGDAHVVVIGNAVDPHLVLDFHAAESVPRVQSGRSAHTIGCAARLDAQKDHETLFEALAILDARGFDFVCLLAGYGCDTGNPKLTRMIERHDLAHRIVPLGVMARMGRFYRSIDLLVLSSAYGESMPLVLQEAAALGRRIVATDVGAARTLVGPLDAIVPPRDPRTLAVAIQTVLERQATSPTGPAHDIAAPTAHEYVALWHAQLLQEHSFAKPIAAAPSSILAGHLPKRPHRE